MTGEEAIAEFQNVKDLIRQDGKDWFDERDLGIIDMAIEALSADAEVKYSFIPMNDENLIEVVRCKDCRHIGLFSCPLADNDFQKDDDYCSWGERREP